LFNTISKPNTQARNRAYALCGQVHFAGKKIRTDIAYQALV
jgi:phosphoribosylamine--glycine ligase